MTAFTSLLQVVQGCDRFPYTIDRSSSDPVHHYLPFVVGSDIVGHVLPDVVFALTTYNSTQVGHPFVITSSAIKFAEWVHSYELRTNAVRVLMDTWREKKLFSGLAGWRNELYPVYGTEGILFVMERAAAALLGISTFGVHLNAYTEKDGEVHMWVARRALTKPTWPGLLDNCVAGGISHGYGVRDTIIKECDEEASIPDDLADKARSVNVITYYTYTDAGLQPETEYIFDLPLPANFKPTPRDGEVECFYLWPLSKVKQTILQNEWKTNSAIVAIDFMMRHAYITPDEEPDYINISYHLHRHLPFPTPRLNTN